jgi:transposase InsO family protein
VKCPTFPLFLRKYLIFWLRLLTANDYFTKWIEAIPMKRETKSVVRDFLEERIITRFGVHANIMIDNAKDFNSVELSTFYFDYGIVLSHSYNYYPQGNGLVESNTNDLMATIKTVMGDKKRSWDNNIKYALWEDRVTKKQTMGKFPFELVYGMEVTLLVHLKIPIYHLLQHFTTYK